MMRSRLGRARCRDSPVHVRLRPRLCAHARASAVRDINLDSTAAKELKAALQIRRLSFGLQNKDCKTEEHTEDHGEGLKTADQNLKIIHQIAGLLIELAGLLIQTDRLYDQLAGLDVQTDIQTFRCFVEFRHSKLHY
jgi:hypothetical protein